MNIYSPIHSVRLEQLTAHNVQLDIKRDDLIHPFISGNKWRKLKYILQQAKQENKNVLVTFGGAYSNHLLATATAGAIFGLKTIGIVRGEPVNNDTLFLCKLHGMELQFVSRDAYRNKREIFQALFNKNKQAFFINEGGAGAEGAKGCSEIIQELTENYNHIFCAAGTGTTIAGILNGLTFTKKHSQVHVIPVLKDSEYLKENINELLHKPITFHFHKQYHFGGYAKTNVSLLNFITHFTQQTGIMLDPIYTGKALFALFDLLQERFFNAEDKVLFIHTGGLFGTLGMKERFAF